MLVEFSVENFRSIKELQTLHMQASAQKESDYHNLNFNRIHSPKVNLDLIKTKAIFGANASGKSNLILALITFWKNLWILGLEDNLAYWIDPYKLDSSTINEPSFFQIITFSNGIQYRYGFTADKEKIHSEWLYVKDKKETPYFVREGQNITYSNENSFSEVKNIIKKDNKFFKENSLVLAILNAFNGKISSEVYKSIVGSILINSGQEIADSSTWKKGSIQNWKTDESYRNFTKKLLKSVDRTIFDFEIKTEVTQIEGFEKQEKKDFLISKRKFNNKVVSFDFESAEGKGTQKIFGISSSLYSALFEGKVLVIDEFDSQLHPDLTREIVILFQSKDAHPNAQLIFVTHDSNLLDSDLLRRDQITFVEKNKSGETEIYDLSDIKGVRDTDLFEKNYLKGKYGGMPILNNFQNKVFHG